MTESGWTVDTLHEHLLGLLAEKDKAITAALVAAEKAVAKAEMAAEKRFDAVNEFRQTLSDQAATFMPRREAEQRTAQNAEKIDALSTITSAAVGTLSSRLDLLQGKSAGAGAAWGVVIGAAAVVVALISVAVAAFA